MTLSVRKNFPDTGGRKFYCHRKKLWAADRICQRFRSCSELTNWLSSYLFIATVVSKWKMLFFREINPNSIFSVIIEDKKRILFKGGCLCGRMNFEIICRIQADFLETRRFSDDEQYIYDTGNNSSPTWYIWLRNIGISNHTYFGWIKGKLGLNKRWIASKWVKPTKTANSKTYYELSTKLP